MTDNETRPILCGECDVEVKQRTDPNGHVFVVCPDCGASDTLDNAVREAADHVADKIARETPYNVFALPRLVET